MIPSLLHTLISIDINKFSLAHICMMNISENVYDILYSCKTETVKYFLDLSRTLLISSHKFSAMGR